MSYPEVPPEAPRRRRAVVRARAVHLARRSAASALGRRVARVYRRHEHAAPAVFFFGGVVWDVLTLGRIDDALDNLLLLAYLVALGAMIVAQVLAEAGHRDESPLLRFRGWYPAAIQFLMGALFSAYVIYYLQSASLTESAFFLLLLVALLVANEFIHRRTATLYLLVGLYYLVACSFFIFFIPVVTRTMSYATFTAATAFSLILVGGMVLFFWGHGVLRRGRELGSLAALLLALAGTFHLFYVQNWIPPVPLALRHGGIYHHVEPEDGVYALTYEAPPLSHFWREHDAVFRLRPGDAVYCFAAIFAPTRLEKEIVHEWRYYDPAQEAWVVTDRIGYRITGGRDGGWRGYTRKRNVQPGRWAVNVETREGRILGRIPFEVVEAASARPAELRRLRYE